MPTPLISVIVLVYNNEDTVERCIDSIIAQSFESFEVVVISDGSVDSSVDLIKKAPNKGVPIRVIELPHSGITLARRSGVMASRGDLVCFVDADDFIHQDFLGIMYETLIQHQADIVECERIRTANPKELRWTPVEAHTRIFEQPELLLRVLAYENISIGMWNKLYRKELFWDIEWPTTIYHEDEALLPQLVERANRMAEVYTPLYAYIQREGSVMHGDTLSQRIDDLVHILVSRFYHYRARGSESIDSTNLDTISRVAQHYLHRADAGISDASSALLQEALLFAESHGSHGFEDLSVVKERSRHA